MNLTRVVLVAACAACAHVRITNARSSPIADMLPVDDGVIAYDVVGAGPPVVLIHGGFGDRRMWDGQMSALAARHRVVRYDLRGYGGSAAPTADCSACDRIESQPRQTLPITTDVTEGLRLTSAS